MSYINKFAFLLGDQNEQAMAIFEDALDERRRILGEEPSHNVSDIRESAPPLEDKDKQEMTIFEDVLDERRWILGERILEAVPAMNNPMATLGRQRMLDESGSCLDIIKPAEEKDGVLEVSSVLHRTKPTEATGISEVDPEVTIRVRINDGSDVALDLDDLRRFGDDTTISEAAATVLLEKRRQTLGDHHPDTISAMITLAFVLGRQREFERGTIICREVLEERKQTLGDDHPDTILAMEYLGSMLWELGKFEEVTSLVKNVVEKRRHTLGDDHPDTLLAMNTLAMTLRGQGEPRDATFMLLDVLNKRKKILGDDHPDTISTMSDLALTLGDRSKFGGAATMFMRVLEKRKEELGNDHPDTISAISRIAVILGKQKKYEEATTMMLEVLEKRKQILGDDHADTISAMETLAKILVDQKKFEEGIAIFSEVLEKRKQILGQDHPKTLSAIRNHAIAFWVQGMFEKATAIFTEVLEKRRRIQGDSHPDTLSAMINVAEGLKIQGKSGEAAAIFKEVFNKRHILGKNHPAIVSANRNLPLDELIPIGDPRNPFNKIEGVLPIGLDLFPDAISNPDFDREDDLVPDAFSNSLEYKSEDNASSEDFIETLKRRAISAVSELKEDLWTHTTDNRFASGLLDQLEAPASQLEPLVFPQLCKSCRDIDILGDGFELLFDPTSLVNTTKQCELCSLFRQALEESGRSGQTAVRVYRDGSCIRIDGRDMPILSICGGLGSKDAHDDIQIGYPLLPEAGSQVHLKLLQEWLRVCDGEHDCGPEFDSPLPTRVLDVGDDADPNLLRLHSASPEDRGRYIALSHCWGNVAKGVRDRYCTYKCNIDRKRESIDWGSLPRTFQNAVTITRALGVRYLWIDSICIIQRHEGCSNDCGGLEDWGIESKNMETYFSCAYCTIAATSATDSTAGFLGPRAARRCVRVQNASGSPFYVCEAIDDFHTDVEEGALNQRGWVLQEKALSRRTINFATKQTYWQCGKGIHCETLTKMSNPRANFMADPQFPRSLMDRTKSAQTSLFQILYELYSRLGITSPTDRSIAISGLENRLAQTFKTEASHGVFRSHLHRSLLWQRSWDGKMKRIVYPTHRKVPSWSWMTYEGAIRYMDIPFGEVEWSNAVHCHSPDDPHTGIDHVQQANDKFGSQLKAPLGEILLDESSGETPTLIFDEKDETDGQKLTCVVIGRDISLQEPGEERKYYVLLVTRLDSEEACEMYGRVGVSIVQRRHLLLLDSEARVV